ncbi:MAG: sensor histidine kinase, partial [Alphaproteobacteria bacterium]|nr:sensor histidine kinase [Alphaproteobacteria bacterium]
HQAIQNLIDNAIKYGADNSAVTITARLCNGFPQKSDKYFSDLRQVISIAVHNAGNPIPPHLIPRLFERFYRGDFAKIRRAEGTGLGLGIVQQIIQKHDGVIDAESRAETGTTFTIYLPIDL